ncbi:hypothetical protein JCM11641_000129 [Rhodosporidiobolus odoratus]
MGIPSPAAYDALFLEKCKLLLQAAFANPSRRGTQLSYHEFVDALDETTTRHRKHTANFGAGPSTSAPAARRRFRDTSRDPYTGRTMSARQALIDFSESDSDSSMEDMPPARLRVLRPTRIRIDRRPEAAENPSPTLADRQRQIDDLFGYVEPPDFYQMFPDHSASAPAAQSGSAVSVTAPQSSITTLTFEELWSILLLDEPFPADSVTTFSSFLERLNSSSYSSTPLRADDIPSLITELTGRDPAIPFRARNALRRRADEARTGGSSEASHLREGIWHASFVEHLGDARERETPLDLSSAGNGTPAAFDFAEFARQRRAERRRRQEGAVPPVVHTTGLDAVVGDSPQDRSGTPTITVTDASTPATSFALSPAGGACPSPTQVLTSTPVSAPAPAAIPRTTAAIIEAHSREQRRIARLPSPAAAPASSTATFLRDSDAPASAAASTGAEDEADGPANASLRAVVDALQRARESRQGAMSAR